MRQTNSKRVRITITTSEQVETALKGLVEVGLHGASVAEAAERLVCLGLQNDLKKKRQQAIDKP